MPNPLSPGTGPPAGPVGILGFGLFGRAFADLLSESGYAVRAFDTAAPVPPPLAAASPGELCEPSRVVVVAVPIAATETALRQLRPHLDAGHLVVDVGSVKLKQIERFTATLEPLALLRGAGRSAPLGGVDTVDGQTQTIYVSGEERMPNTGLMSLRSIAGGAVLSVLLTGGASAVPFAEVGDAGQLVGTAQSISGGASSISGTISSSTDADLYRFGHPGGAFGATTVAQPGSLNDSQLFLFDAAGNGIVANDDSVGVRAALSLASLAAGTYLLGISSFNGQKNASLDAFPRQLIEPEVSDRCLDPQVVQLFIPFNASLPESNERKIPLLEELRVQGDRLLGLAFRRRVGSEDNLGLFLLGFSTCIRKGYLTRPTKAHKSGDALGVSITYVVRMVGTACPTFN